MRVVAHDEIEENNGCVRFGVGWSPGFVLGRPPRGGS